MNSATDESCASPSAVVKTIGESPFKRSVVLPGPSVLTEPEQIDVFSCHGIVWSTSRVCNSNPPEQVRAESKPRERFTKCLQFLEVGVTTSQAKCRNLMAREVFGSSTKVIGQKERSGCRADSLVLDFQIPEESHSL